MRTPVCLVLAAALCAAGCGPAGYAPVSGVVTLDGQPLAGASVTFQPVGGKDNEPGVGSYGKTDDQGRFTLKTVDKDAAGAKVGQHRVYVSKAESSGEGDEVTVVDRVPSWYAPPHSKLTCDVPASGKSDVTLDLSTTRPR